MICTFFGHRNCTSGIIPRLKATIEDLILNHSVECFYVGNHGNFDLYAQKCLREIKEDYPQITFYVVLAYLPSTFTDGAAKNTILADGVESVLRKFAILQRNKWMLECSDYVVAYVTKSFGGAAQFYELAKKKKKICINLA